MSTSTIPSHFSFAGRQVRRMGYGAMQLAGPRVFGPPKDRAACVAVLQAAIAAGVDHIDTADFYGPHVTNQIIREALHPYSDKLTLVTKIGARRGRRQSAPSRPGLAGRGQPARLRPWPYPPWHRPPGRNSGAAPAGGIDPAYRAEQCHPGTDKGSASDDQRRLCAEHVQPGAPRG